MSIKPKKPGKPGNYPYKTISETDGRIPCPGCKTELPRLEVGQSVRCPRCRYHIQRVSEIRLAYDIKPVLFNGARLPIAKLKTTEPLKLVKDGTAGDGRPDRDEAGETK